MRQEETNGHSGTVVQSLSTPTLPTPAPSRQDVTRKVSESGARLRAPQPMGGLASTAGAASPRAESRERSAVVVPPSLPLSRRAEGLAFPLPASLSPPGRPASLSFPFAAMAAAEQEQFYLLLGNLLSPDNAVRKQAEVTAPPRDGPGRQAGLSDLRTLPKGRREEEGLRTEGGREAAGPAEPHV